MRKLFIIAILALLPLSAFAWGVATISGGVAAAGGCSTQTTVTILATNDDHSESLHSEGYQVGQSFLATESVTLYSIIVRIDTKPGGNPTLVARIGTSANLGTYTGQTAATKVTVAAGNEVELVFPEESRPTISSGTTYYVGVSNSAVYNNNCELSIDLASAYTDGVYLYNNVNDNDWNLDKTYNADLYLKYKKCD